MLAVALASGGCGATPPQAPVGAASAISDALTSIAAACGESYRLQAFTPHPDLTGLETSAAASARRLAPLVREHPQWIYQGDTLTEIARLSAADLRGCALPRAAAALAPG